jgi:RNA polymerase sigma factor (sigma-70 family)
MPTSAPVSTPTDSGSGRASALPRDAGRATETLYRRHGKTVFRYSWHVLGSREDAEDATQATFLAVHGALARGTAVIEPGAWVLGIARNECTGRLRTRARRPTPGMLGDDLTAVAGGSVEFAAEVRDELRIAQQTLSALPEQERDAFLLREWVGLPTQEVALALGVEAGYVEYLTARARRSLVLAVGGLEAPVGCGETRAALETSTLGRAAKVHLLRCPVCRGVRRALRPRQAVPTSVPAVAERLAGVLPGFGAGGGGIIVALTTKATAAPVITKAAALVAATLLAGGAVGEELRRSHPAHHRSAGASLGRGGESLALAAPAARAHQSVLLVSTRIAPTRHARAAASDLAVLTIHASRGGAAGKGHDAGASGGSHDGRSSGSHEGRSSGSRDGGSSGARDGASSGSHDSGSSGSTSDSGTSDHTSGRGGTSSSGTSGHAAGDSHSSADASSTEPGSSDGHSPTAGDGVSGNGTSGDGTSGTGSSGDGSGTSADASSGDALAAGTIDGHGDGTSTPPVASMGDGGGDSAVPVTSTDSPVATTSG